MLEMRGMTDGLRIAWRRSACKSANRACWRNFARSRRASRRLTPSPILTSRCSRSRRSLGANEVALAPKRARSRLLSRSTMRRVKLDRDQGDKSPYSMNLNLKARPQADRSLLLAQNMVCDEHLASHRGCSGHALMPEVFDDELRKHGEGLLVD